MQILAIAKGNTYIVRFHQLHGIGYMAHNTAEWYVVAIY